jgi:hypothetical protein
MNRHHVWRPRMDRDPLMNPFAPATAQHAPNLDHVELDDTEDEATDETLVAGDEALADDQPNPKE